MCRKHLAVCTEPFLRGHRSYKVTFSLSQRRPLNTGLTVLECVYDLCDDCEVPIIEEIEHAKLMAANIETGLSSLNIKGNG